MRRAERVHVARKKGDHGGFWDQRESAGRDGVEHRWLFDKNEKRSFARARGLHKRAQHGVRRLRKIPLRRHLGTEIRQHFHGAHQAPEIFYLGGHPLTGVTHTRAV